MIRLWAMPNQPRPVPQTLRDLYGHGGANARDIENRAIRAEVDGGDELLDATALLYQAAQKLTGEAAERADKALKQAKGARNAAADQVVDKHKDEST